MKQEAILLDLLRVVSHHRARLATPIRTVQKIYSEADLENVPFSDSIFTRNRETVNRPYLLIEPSYKIKGDDKSKASTRSIRTNEDKEAQPKGTLASDYREDVKAGSTSSVDLKTDDLGPVKSNSNSNTISKHSERSTSNPQIRNLSSDSLKHESTDKSLQRATSKSPSIMSDSSNGKTDVLSTVLQSKQDAERSVASPSITTHPLEENIVLGVALEGSKRTLLIEEEMAISPCADESEELASQRNGGSSPVSKDAKDGQRAAVPSSTSSD